MVYAPLIETERNGRMSRPAGAALKEPATIRLEEDTMSHQMNPRDMARSAILQQIKGMNHETVMALADCEIITLDDLAKLHGNSDRRHEIARIICATSVQMDDWADDAMRLVGKKLLST